MGADVAYFELEGGGSKGVRLILQGGIPGGVDVWGGDMGPDLQYGAGPEWFSIQGRRTAHQEVDEEADKEAGGLGLGLSSTGGGNGGSRL